MATKRSCCIRFSCFSSSSSSDEKGQDRPISAGPRSSPSAIDNTIVAPNNSEARGSEIEPAVEANLCNVSGPAHQSNKAPVSASQNILQKSDETDPPTASSEASKYDMPAEASTSVPSNAVPAPSQSDKAPASASPNILPKSDQDESVNVNKNVSGYNETDPPTASSKASKYDMPAKALTSVPSNAVPAPSQSINVPQKSEGANVNINQNVSGAPRCSTGSTPSSSSPSQLTKSDFLKAIVDEVEGKGVYVDLEKLMDHISNLLKWREQEMLQDKEASNTGKFSWPEGFKKLNDILSWGTDLKKFTELMSSGLDFASKLIKIMSGPVKEFLKGIGQASSATAGLLVVAYALERFDELSTNNKICWDLIIEMSRLATVVKRWNESSKGTVDVIEDATALVVEGAIMCCTRIGRSAWNRFFLSSNDKADLSGITQKLYLMYSKINADIGISHSTDFTRVFDGIANIEGILAAIESNRNPPLSRKYPENAVGIDKPIEDVLGLLDCESDQNAVTVILCGVKGMGKTTLADAVCSQQAVGECKYSHVQLFEGKYSKPDILSLQKEILKDLMVGQKRPVPIIKKYQDGWAELQSVLTDVYALIYIDNVLEGKALRKLLPSDMSKAKKVRLLLTARNENVMTACPGPCTDPKVYWMKGIQDEEALKILEKEIKEGISHDQFRDIIRTCRGNPCMLTLIATFIGRSKNKEEDYSELMRQKDKWTIKGLKKMLYRPRPEYALPGPSEGDESSTYSPLISTEGPSASTIEGHQRMGLQKVVNVTPPGSSASSSDQTKSGLLNTIGYKDNAQVEVTDVVDLDKLIEHLSKLLQLREKQKRPHQTAWIPSIIFTWPDVPGLKKLKEILSVGIDLLQSELDSVSALSNIISEHVKKLLKDIGRESVATAGLLAVVYSLERFDDLSTNEDKCWDLITEMSNLASAVKSFEESRKGMQDVLEEATTLIVEGAIMYCAQMVSSPWKRFFSASKLEGDLSDIRHKLNVMYLQTNIKIGFRVLTAIECNGRSPLSIKYPYPLHAVGIDEPIKDVLSLLEIESDQKAVTVILHGFGGMGKTTLADAVFSHVVGCRYSRVQLFENIDSKPTIIELQKKILKDLMGPEEPVPDIRKYEDGQRELGERLEKIHAFIYIDNVLEGDALKKLLPQDMSTAKKVRLLLTARNENVKKACPRPCTEPKIYRMQKIQPQAALIILKREINDGILTESQFNDIIDTCGGIPLRLTLAGPFIRHAKNKKEAYSTLVLRKDKWPISMAFETIHWAFAYEALPRDCKELLLDICSYFKGWDWKTVEDIVGKEELEMLESRALVRRTTNDLASVHDVILTLAQQKSKEESNGKEVRLAFNSASELEQLLQEEGAAEGIKGIWLSNNKDVLKIPATTLNLMHKSLRVLQLGKLAMVEGKCSETFKELVFFEAKVEQLPFQDVSKLEQLRYLSYEPNDLKLYKMPSSLRHMELDGRSHGHAFQISSNAFQELKHLRILRLVNFSKLKNLPEKLGDQVEGLHELSLSNCTSITKLPDSISNLQSLQILKMDGCSKLTELPVDFGSLSSLRELHLDECTDLKALPDSAEKLSSLTLLNLLHCYRLPNLPPCVGNLTRLVELNLCSCYGLESIPKGIGELKLLRTLDVSFCHGLTRLPDGFCNLSSITTLSFSNCSNLEKLPDRFGQLASLKVLDLSSTSLQKLPEGFGQLKNLEVLDLQHCEKLKELCNDFHCLSSLQNLNLSKCDRLEGKSMDHVVKMNRLQLVRIEGSKELVESWKELIERDGDAGSRSLTVISGQRSSIISRVEKEDIEKNLLSELDGLLTNGRGEKFHLSDLPANTLILVMWDFPSSIFIEELIDDELQIKIIYIGPDFDKFSTKVKNNIFVVHVPTTRATEMLEKVHLTLDIRYGTDYFLQIDRRMVGDGQRDEYRPCWRFLTEWKLVEIMLSNCNRYLQLKQLAEEDQGSNIGLLRALFAPQGDETTPVFQKNESSQQHPTPNSELKATCGVDKLEGKTILLEIRPPHSFDHDIRLPSLKEMYLRQKDTLNFEIISIPLVKPREKEFDSFRDPFTDLFTGFSTEVSDVFDVHKQFSREVPWLVLQNPWMTITRAVQYFLAKQCTTGWEEIKKCEKWYPTINWIIDPKGRITIYPPRDMMDRGEAFKVLSNYLESESYQVRWGVNASLTPLGKIEEVRKKEWEQLKNMSTLEFLFNHLKSVQVKNLMFQGKFICLYTGRDVEKITYLMEQFRDSIHFIHVSHEWRVLRLAYLDSWLISKDYYYPLENTTEMEGTSLLKLSRHESVSFMMRLHHLEEEINVMDESDKHLCELKSLLDSVITFFDEGGNSVAGLTERDLWPISLSDRKDTIERLIKTMMKDFEMHDEDILIKKMQQASAAAVEPQNVDVYFDALRNYISELWEVQFYRPFKFKKEGEKTSPPRVTWPTSRGFCRLKNLLSEGANDDWIKDVISRHSEEDACHTIIKSVLKDIEEAEWAVAGLLAVAELLERTETLPNYNRSRNRIEWLSVVDEMFRLAQYCKQFNQKDELWRRMKCGAIVVILLYSIGCCWLIDPSKFEFSYRVIGWYIFEFSGRWGDSRSLLEAEMKLRNECDKLAKTMTEDRDNESGSLSNLECYSWGFRLWPQREDEGGPSSVHESSASVPKAGSTGSTGEEE